MTGSDTPVAAEPYEDFASRLTIGAPGNAGPPFGGVLRAVQSAERAGFDSVWWSDHWMGWYPSAVWDGSRFDVARKQSSPHIYFDVMVTLGAASQVTSSMRLGTSVSDVIRRHPVSLAQEALSMQHASGGRFILGLGSGERENIEPYGLPFDRRLARVIEAIEIIRLLWGTHEPVDYDGELFRLKQAVLGLDPPDEGPPPIWLAAHGPRMLEVAGRLADGWYPMTIPVDEYQRHLSRIAEVRREAGREAEPFVPALWSYVLVAETRKEAAEILNHPLVRGLALLLPASWFQRYGVDHPLQLGYGLLDYIPTRVSAETFFRAVEAIPFEVLDEFFLWGTPDDIVERTLAYARVGCRHVTWWNVSFLGDLTRTGPSFKLLAAARKDVDEKWKASRRAMGGVPST